MLLIITLSRRVKRGKAGIFAPALLEYSEDFPMPNHAIFDGKYMDLP
jgi:hypothetical protein